MNLVFISRQQYPDGGAASNRHMAYAKGLIELGHRVTFLLLSEQNSKTERFRADGIDFICAPANDADNPKKNIVRKIYLQYRLTKWGASKISEINKENNIDALILLTSWIQDLVPFIGLAKKRGLKLLHERTEYPFVDMRENLKAKIDLKILQYVLLHRFDGIYVINRALRDYFKRYAKQVPVEIINMIVDPLRFKETSRGNLNYGRYIAFCGILNGEKDGVDLLVRAFIKVSIEGKIPEDVNLLLIGDFESDEFRIKLEKIIHDCSIRERIILTGRMKRDEIPGILNRASALALARPDNHQARGGFPTKLGEYLATAKPVIITNTGEISLFLKDGYNAYIAEPGNVDSFAGKISEVFSDYDRALAIGKRGIELVGNEFNYLKESEKLAHFILTL